MAKKSWSKKWSRKTGRKSKSLFGGLFKMPRRKKLFGIF